jgi:hypothetical protein
MTTFDAPVASFSRRSAYSEYRSSADEGSKRLTEGPQYRLTYSISDRPSNPFAGPRASMCTRLRLPRALWLVTNDAGLRLDNFVGFQKYRLVFRLIKCYRQIERRVDGGDRAGARVRTGASAHLGHCSTREDPAQVPAAYPARTPPQWDFAKSPGQRRRLLHGAGARQCYAR